jgi:predicted NBD/HSP70 family sugar kinase
MNILVIDIGASNVKFTLWRKHRHSRFSSGKKLTPEQFLQKITSHTAKWRYHAVSIGFPGPVMHGRPAGEPPNLGNGWVGFDFEKRFKVPVKVMNDGAMQALGSYRGGRMLFVGLGTGVGSALILDDVIVPLDLGELGYSKKKTVGEVLGKHALRKDGPKRWEKSVHQIVGRLAAAFRTDYVVIGGGSAKQLKRLPRGAWRGSNRRAFIGGARLWGDGLFHARPRKHTWVIT